MASDLGEHTLLHQAAETSMGEGGSHQPPHATKDGWDKLRILGGVLIPVWFVVVVGIGAKWIEHVSHHEEQELQYIQLAIGLLREDPAKSQSGALRDWAVDVLDAHSGVKLSAAAKSELRSKSFFADGIVFDRNGNVLFSDAAKFLRDNMDSISKPGTQRSEPTEGSSASPGERVIPSRQ